MLLTNKKNAVDITTFAVASMFSQNGLDDETEIKEVSRKLAASRANALQPIPGLNISVTKEDFNLENKTPREARLAFFRKLTEPIYDEGAAGLAKLATNAEMRQSIVEGARPLAIVSAANHQKIRGVFIIFAIISALLLIFLSLLSYRSGRLLSPGIVLSLAAFPGSLIMLVFYAIEQKGIPAPDAADQGPLGAYAPMAAALAPLVGQAIRPAFLAPLAVGVSLIIFAIVYAIASKIIFKLSGKNNIAK